VRLHSTKDEASSKEDEALVDELEERLGGNGERTIVGGFSLGARIAAMLTLRQPVRGFIGLSFPFHRHGQPLERHGLAALRRVTVPTLVVQGTRDSHGNEAHVRGMSLLPPQVELMWLQDANHRWNSRGPAGLRVEDHAKDAALAIQSFVQGLVSTAHV
jgi:predicted alpha/beta-hydrolase family hydrolase